MMHLVVNIEFFKNNGDIRSRFALTSLGKIRHAEGFKASEIWFFFFTKILHKVPFFITLASLGLSKFSEPFYNSLISIYKNFLPIPTNISSQTAIFFMIAVVLLSDFAQFVAHFIGHKLPILWDLHEMHHASSEMVILNLRREIPLFSLIASS